MINYIAKKLNDIYRKSIEKEAEKEKSDSDIDKSINRIKKQYLDKKYESVLPLPVNNKMETASDIYKKTLGTTGISGTSGFAGPSGMSGTSGFAGPSGVSGSPAIYDFGDGTSGNPKKKILHAGSYSGDSYADYIADQVDKSIKYSEYIAEKLDESIRYSEYVADKLDGTKAYRDWMTEYAEQHTPKKKEIHRIYTAEDPYGEENWEE